MALYRTYRPATFADVVGQEHVTEPLCRALDSGRINHAYLFSGPRGCGKTSSARILARSLNCVEGPTSTPCGVCDSCVALAPGGPGNLDVMELDAASHGNVDDTRDLRDRASYSPAASRYRVFIIDEAHMVSSAGFNALLKVVEEPPEHLIFVFATTEPEKVLPTIRSRTHHYPFRLLAPPTMRGLLESICVKEGVTVEPAVYPLVVRAGGGSPRDSLSILDQLLAGADEKGVAYDRAVTLLGVTDVALIDQSVDALADGDGSALFEAVERLVDAGHDPRRFGVDLLERFRDLILMQAVPDAVERGLVEAPGDQIDRMRAQLNRIGPGTLTRYAETVHAALGEMRGTTSPRLLLEVMCARMLLPAATDTESAMLQRIERIEAQLGGTDAPRVGHPLPAAVATDSPVQDAPVSNGSTPAPPPDPGARFVRRSRRPAADPQPSEAVGTTDTPADDVPANAPSPEDPPAEPNLDDSPADATSPAESPPAEPPSSESNSTEIPPEESAPLSDAGGDEDSGVTADEDSGVTVDAVRTAWGDICAAVGRLDKIIAVMVSAAVVREVDGRHLTISHDTAPLVARLGSERGRTVIATAMHETFGGEWSVTCVHAAGGGTTPPASAPATTRSSAAYSRRRGADARAPVDQTSREPRSAAAPADDEPPPPEEPAPEPEPPVADEDLSDAERDEMIADAHSNAPDPRQDPEQVAMQLLATELGARRID